MKRTGSTPEHPGTYVQREILEDMNVTEAAKRLRVGRPTLSRFLNARSSLSKRMARRLEQEFGADPTHLQDLQARFDESKHRDRAAVTSGLHTPSVLTIKAREIARWAAGNIEARHDLPVLIRRLVHSTSTAVTKSDFPGYDQAQRRGWDGRIEATSATPWVPAGTSGWELSCERGPDGKANRDYEKRVEKVDESERRVCSFVFVTPYEWGKKNDWADEKRELGDWKDVRAYDASNLEEWIEASAATQVWFAELLGRPVDGYRSLAQFWEDWASAAEPRLSRAIFDSAIEMHAAKFFAWLNEEPARPFTIAADSRNEAIAFLACVLDSAEESQAPALDRAIVFDSSNALERLTVAAPGALLAVAGTTIVEKSFAKFHHPQHCVAPQLQRTVPFMRGGNHVELQCLTPRDFKFALGEMEIDGAEADRYDRISARAPTVLRRCLAKAPEDRRPPWADDHDTVEWAVAPALIGAWHSASEADRRVVESISDTTYDEFESRFLKLRSLEDPPVWSVGAYHGVCSRIDALFTCAQSVRQTDLDRFFTLARRVFSERDQPARPSGDGGRTDTRNVTATYNSGALRGAARETLILLAQYGDSLLNEHPGGSLQQRVSQFVRDLMQPLTVEKLLSYQDDLPDLAEAAPDAFLGALEADLDGGENAVLDLLAASTEGGVWQRPARTELLWALERLAWFPNQEQSVAGVTLQRITDILARLAKLEIPDRQANTPFNSLVSLFRSWMPQTAAPLAQRLSALKGLMSNHSAVGRRLCMELLPRHRAFAGPDCLPKWRGDTSSAGKAAPRNEIRATIDVVREFALNWLDHDEQTLGDLIDRIEAFSEDDQATVWTRVSEWTVTASDDEKAVLKDRIRKHRPEFDDNRMTDALELLTPADPVARHRWLFTAWWDPELERVQRDSGLDEYDKQLAVRRIQALREVLDSRGRAGLAELIETCGKPWEVGYLLEEVLDAEEHATFVHESLGRTTVSAYGECIRGLLAAARPQTIEELVQRLRDDNHDSARLELFLAMPFRSTTWRILDEENTTLQASYWCRVAPPDRLLKADELNESVDRLLEAQRPDVAFRIVRFRLEHVETERLRRLLHGLAAKLGEPPPRERRLTDALESLERRPEVSTAELAQLELALLPLLWLSERGIPNLEKQILTTPSLFARAVVLGFARNDNEEDPPEWRVEDPARRAVLSSSAHRLLLRLRRVPGSREDGDVDVRRLGDWLSAARKLCADLGRSQVGDVIIGEWLARASAKANIVRPSGAIAEAIEQLKSEDVDRGFVIGAFNARGVSMRPTDGGGDPERELSNTYRQLAREMTAEWPRTGRLLEQVAESFDEDGRRWDKGAKVSSRMPSHGLVFDA